MLNKQKKSEIVQKLKELLRSSGFVAFVNFHGLSVAKATELRRGLRKAGSGYMVSKKTLLGVAAREENLELNIKNLEGEVAVVCASEDNTVDTASVIADFVKKNKDMLKIIGALFSTQGAKHWIDVDQVKRLAAIPSRETLIRQLMYVINGPARNLVGVLSAPMRDLVSVLGKIKK